MQTLHGQRNQRTSVDAVIDQVFGVLPAPSVPEIARRLGLDYLLVQRAIWKLRRWAQRDPDHYGWTMPHARRGSAESPDRFVAVLVDSRNEPYFELEAQRAVQDGAIGTLHENLVKAKHAATALGLAIPYYESGSLRKRLADYKEDMDYIARRGERLVEDMLDDRRRHG